MLKKILCSALLLAAVSAHAEIVVTDDTGARIRLAAPPKRIVSLAPHLTESLYALGAGDRIAATVDYSDYPEAAKKLPRVGGYSRFDVEMVAAQKPDLVIAWESGNTPAQIEKLRALGVTLYVTQPNSIDDLANTLDRLNRLTGDSETGRMAVAQFRERLAALRSRYSARPPVRTFYQVWKQPLLTIGGPQIISDVIKLCGGENVFGALKTMSPAVTVEAVLAAAPEVIVASGMGEARPEWLDDWKRWTTLPAVARNNLFFIPPDLIQRHTPRLLDGTERMCQFLETARSHRSGK